jgi:hypothetical protein
MGHSSPVYLASVPIIVIYLFAESIISNKSVDYYFSVVTIALIGIIADYLMMYFELIQFNFEQIFPVWLMILWVFFGLTFSAAYRWLIKLHQLFILSIGAIFGPLAYWAASKLSDVEIVSPLMFTAFSSVFWAMLFLSLSKFHNEARYSPRLS